jgi:hypothetical protein
MGWKINPEIWALAKWEGRLRRMLNGPAAAKTKEILTGWKLKRKRKRIRVE